MNIFNKVYKKVKLSEFANNFRILATGTVISQILILIASPFITRLYSPEALGIFALFMAIISVTSPIVDAGYERAIVSVIKNKDGDDLFFLSIFVSFVACLILFISLYLFEDPLKQFLSAEKLNLFWYVIPLAIFLINLSKIFKTYANRFKNYKLISKALIFKSLSYIIIVISFGYLGFSSTGLFFSELSSSLIIVIFFFTVYRKIFKQNNVIFKQKLLASAKKFIRFPIFIIGPVLLNNLTSLMPIFFLTKLYSDTIVGYYFLALRAIYFPISFISSSISTLHLKKTSELIHKKKKVKPYFIKILLILIGVILIPLFIITLFGPEIFKFIFGKDWQTAGEFAQIVMPAVSLAFVVSSLSSVMIPANKLNYYAIWSCISFISISIFFYFFSNQIEVKLLLKYLTILNIMIYIFYFILTYNSVVKIDKKLGC